MIDRLQKQSKTNVGYRVTSTTRPVHRTLTEKTEADYTLTVLAALVDNLSILFFVIDRDWDANLQIVCSRSSDPDRDQGQGVGDFPKRNVGMPARLFGDVMKCMWR
jgi:hypothetical protein